MPVKGKTPKETIHTEMHKFKHGDLHSGSKHGPVVKSRAQAIAISLSEAGESRKSHKMNHSGHAKNKTGAFKYHD